MQHIRVERRGRVTRIELARPEVLNAINAAMHDELEQAFNAFAADPEQWICVVTGAGRAFCAGTDLKSVVAEGRKPYPAHGYAGLIQRFDCDKPIIAAVNGLALGGGFELALACDIIIAVESAGFGLPEPLVGAVALGGGVHRLARQIGPEAGDGHDPRLAPGRRARGRAAGLRDRGGARWGPGRGGGALDGGDPERRAAFVRASKQAVMRGLDEPDLASALANQARYPAFGTWFNSADAAEGPRAFAEKRAPEWQGR
jgi:crotonobetainyl-CoA hydratase